MLPSNTEVSKMSRLLCRWELRHCQTVDWLRVVFSILHITQRDQSKSRFSFDHEIHPLQNKGDCLQQQRPRQAVFVIQTIYDLLEFSQRAAWELLKMWQNALDQAEPKASDTWLACLIRWLDKLQECCFFLIFFSTALVCLEKRERETYTVCGFCCSIFNQAATVQDTKSK